MTHSPSVRVLISLAVFFGMFSSSIQTVSAVATTTSTAAITRPISVSATMATIQTDNDATTDTSNVIQEIASVSTTPAHPVALRTYTVDSTAYTSEKYSETSAITADGSRVADGVVAANFLPFGTKIRLPTIFGNRIFEVHDRMSKRYWYRVDIWMNSGRDGRKYGIKRSIPLEVVEWGTGETKWRKAASASKK